MGPVDIPFTAHNSHPGSCVVHFAGDGGRSKKPDNCIIIRRGGGAKGTEDAKGREGDGDRDRKGNGNLPLQILALVIRKKIVSAVSLTYQCYQYTRRSRNFSSRLSRNGRGFTFSTFPAEPNEFLHAVGMYT